MPLKTTATLPPGGWVYIQKGNDGKDLARFRSMSPFNEAVTEILRVRQANGLPRASAQEVAEDLDAAQCERLGFDPNWVQSKKKTFTFQPVKLFKVSAQHVRETVQGAAERLGQLVDGASIIRRWFGDGLTPVYPEISQARANVCTTINNGTPCQFNNPGFRPVEAAAEFLRLLAEQKNDLKLSVEGEDKLHTCELCWCHLPTKVHVPLKHILSETPQPMIDKIRQEQPACWIVTEQNSPAI
jgi:hypothetical protein